MITSIIVKAVVSAAILLITGYLIPWLKEKRIYNYVVIAVQAAEQMIKESGKGAEKYTLVCSWVCEKFKISETELKSLIESAVYEINLEKTL